MTQKDLQTNSPVPHDWARLDYAKLEERVYAMLAEDPARFVDEYLCTWRDDRQFLVKRRYDLQPANSPELVDFRKLTEMVQPITATGVAELNSLRVNQIAHTNMYTITRVN